MSDFIKPVLRRKPNNVILHVGTNDATNRKATEIMNHMNDVDNLCQEIKELAFDVAIRITLSELIGRDEDNIKAKKTVKELNNLLANYCTATKYLI